MTTSDKVDKFLVWLDANTDYGSWDDSVKAEVASKLIEVLAEVEPRKHQWEFYMNGTFCRICGLQIGTDLPCR